MSTNRTRRARLVAGAVALLAAAPLLAGCPANGSSDGGTAPATETAPVMPS